MAISGVEKKYTNNHSGNKNNYLVLSTLTDKATKFNSTKQQDILRIIGLSASDHVEAKKCILVTNHNMSSVRDDVDVASPFGTGWT